MEFSFLTEQTNQNEMTTQVNVKVQNTKRALDGFSHSAIRLRYDAGPVSLKVRLHFVNWVYIF